MALARHTADLPIDDAESTDCRRDQNIGASASTIPGRWAQARAVAASGGQVGFNAIAEQMVPSTIISVAASRPVYKTSHRKGRPIQLFQPLDDDRFHCGGVCRRSTTQYTMFAMNLGLHVFPFPIQWAQRSHNQNRVCGPCSWWYSDFCS